MKTDIAKIIGYPAFVLLGPLAIYHIPGDSPLVFFSALSAYFIGVVLMANDPAILRVPYKYRWLGMGVILALTFVLYLLNVFSLGLSWLPITAVNTGILIITRKDPEQRVREARAWARFRNSARRAR